MCIRDRPQTTPSTISATMSAVQAPAAWFHSGSLSPAVSGGLIRLKSSVAPAAATAQRDGIRYENSLTPTVPCRANRQPVKTTWMIANMTSSGMVFSAVFTSEEMIRPNIIAVKPSAMIGRHSSSSVALPRMRPWSGMSRLAKPMTPTSSPCRTVITPSTNTFDIRYADRDRPVARSRS